MCTYIHIYIYIYIYISADLFQSSSVLAYSCNPQCLPIQHPQSLPILTHLEASEHPSIQVSLTAGIPYSTILKGPQLGAIPAHRPFLDADPEPPHAPFWSPWALKSMLPPAQECQIAPLSTLSHPVEPTCHPKPSKQ